MTNEAKLFSKGATLKDVPLHFRGVGLRQWRLDDLSEQAQEVRKTMGKRDPLDGKRISTSRDNYGWRSA